MGVLFFMILAACFFTQMLFVFFWIKATYLPTRKISGGWFFRTAQMYYGYIRAVQRNEVTPERHTRNILKENGDIPVLVILNLLALFSGFFLRGVITATLVTFFTTKPLPEYYSTFLKILAYPSRDVPSFSYHSFVIANCLAVIGFSLIEDFISDWRREDQAFLTACLDTYHAFFVGFSRPVPPVPDDMPPELDDNTVGAEIKKVSGKEWIRFFSRALYRIGFKIFAYGFFYFFIAHVFRPEGFYSDTAWLRNDIRLLDFFNPVVIFSFASLFQRWLVQKIFFPPTKENRSLLAVVLENRESRFHKTQNISIDESLKPLETRIISMCEKLNIHAVEITVVANSAELAGAYERENDRPFVFLSERCINLFREKSDADSILLFLLGHELTHIHGGDTYSTRKQFMSLFLFLIGLFSVSLPLLGGTYFADNLDITNIILYFDAVSLGICLPFMSIAYNDERFWSQIKEFRADRIALRLSNAQRNILEIIGSDFEKLNISPDRFSENKRRTMRISFLSKLFGKYWRRSQLDDIPHPLWTSRVRELQRYGGLPWLFPDVLRYMWKFSWRWIWKRNWRL